MCVNICTGWFFHRTSRRPSSTKVWSKFDLGFSHTFRFSNSHRLHIVHVHIVRTQTTFPVQVSKFFSVKFMIYSPRGDVTVVFSVSGSITLHLKQKTVLLHCIRKTFTIFSRKDFVFILSLYKNDEKKKNFLIVKC